jgi:CHASE3 domain sensor protein
MRVLNRIVAMALLIVFAAGSPAWAQQQHVVDPADMNRAIAEKVDREKAEREQLLRVLDRAEVREMAEKMGLSLERAESAITTLEGEELTRLAAQAAETEDALAGGRVVVISITTLLLLLILIVLIAR